MVLKSRASSPSSSLLSTGARALRSPSRTRASWVRTSSSGRVMLPVSRPVSSKDMKSPIAIDTPTVSASRPDGEPSSEPRPTRPPTSTAEVVVYAGTASISRLRSGSPRGWKVKSSGSDEATCSTTGSSSRSPME